MDEDSHIYELGREETDRVAANFGGGIPKGSIGVISGGHGAGKSTLMQRFVDGFCEKGYYVTYATSELQSHEFISQMDSLGFDIVDPLLDQQLFFATADVNTEDHLTEHSAPQDLLQRLVTNNAIWKADVIILDGFDSLLRNDPLFDNAISENDGDHALQNFVNFLQQVTEQDKTVLITYNTEGVDGETIRPLRRVADILLDIEMTTVGSEIRRNIHVQRFANRHTQVDDQIGFTVQSGTGIIIESRTVA